jgi:hypothetical protein
MNEWNILCPRCKTMSPPGTEYCRECGEVLSEATRAELRRLATILRDLDTRIAASKGSQTVADLREEYYHHYQDLRHAPWQRKAAPGTASEVVEHAAAAPTATATPASPAAAPARPVAAAMPKLFTSAAPLASFDLTEPPAPPAPRPQPAAPPPPPPPAAPAGPVFHWRAFAADQSIAIIAYLGGFLALIATLTLVVSKGQNLPMQTLSIVALVYLSFGSAGFALRRVQRMRTVSGVYLAVFALMTPLVALALYRYELQGLNVPVAGMLCMSAAYATIVYLGLAVQTRFVTYAYLGWAALIVSALSIILWTNVDLQWWVFDLGVTTLALLGPHHLRHHERLGILAEPATQVAALATIPVVIGVQALGIIGLTQTLVPTAFPEIYIQAAALALSACIQVPITAGWRLTVPSWRPRQRDALVDTIDGFNAVFFAEAVGGVTIWIASSIDPNLPLNLVAHPVAVSLGATALAEYGLALALYRWQPRRHALRVFLEVLAVVLASGGAFIVTGEPTPNWPMIVALSAALAVSVGAAMIDGAWWLLVSGLFLSLDYYQVVRAFFPAAQVSANMLTIFFILTLAIWLAALIAGLAERARRFVAPMFVVALLNALYTLFFLPGHNASYQTAVLLTFTAAAFVAGLLERQPGLSSAVTIFFGVLVPLPLALSNWTLTTTLSSPNGLPLSLLALGLTLGALAARRFCGRVWALAPYTIALWAIVVAAFMTSVFDVHAPNWSASGLPFTVWFLLFFAVVAYGVALCENAPVATVVPTVLTGWAVQVAISNPAITDGWHLSLLALSLTLAALAARQRWGRVWALAPYLVALGAVVITAIQISEVGLRAPDVSASGLPFTSWFLLFFAVVAFGVALWENERLATIVPGALAFWALRLVSSDPASVTLVFALIAGGAAARQWCGRGWNVAVLIAAAAGSVSVALQLNNLGVAAPNWQVAFLLALAVAAYLVAAQEGEPALSLIAVIYALVAVAVLPGPNNLLPTLVLTFTLAGLGALRQPFLRARVRREWAYAPYAAAIGSSIFAATRVPLNAAGQVNAGGVEGLLLIFAAVSYVLVVLEGEPLATIIPALYAMASVFVQPDAHALLPLALGLALLGLIAGRAAGMRWAWAFYAAAAVAATATIIYAQNDSAFQATALLLLAALTYVIAAVESRPDVLVVALVLGLLALSAGANALHLASWLSTLAFVALGWLYTAGARLWPSIPWLRQTRGVWWVEAFTTQANSRWSDPRQAGWLVHRYGGLLVVTGAALIGIFAPGAFDIHNPQTLTAALSLLALAGMLWTVTPRLWEQVGTLAQRSWFRLVLYLAGELVALAITWTARFSGADNIQWFVLAPGTYQLLIGVFLPADQHVPYARRVGQFASLSGSLLLLLPTLYQSFTEPTLAAEVFYGSAVFVEALIIIGLGVGTHLRSLVLVGSAFILIDALSVVGLALRSGVPIALVVGVLALLLIGLATWLSLRTRREGSQT